VILAVLLLPFVARPQQAPSPWVLGVGPIEITVSDADRALKFYSEVLSFEKVSDQNVRDADYLRLEGASASGARVVRMRLEDEYVELGQFAGTEGRPFPPTRAAMIAGFSTSPLS
jgi:catechol 2,3-dioxygenase-like lactoylglutathione lyase family enzyme